MCVYAWKWLQKIYEEKVNILFLVGDTKDDFLKKFVSLHFLIFLFENPFFCIRKI